MKREHQPKTMRGVEIFIRWTYIQLHYVAKTELTRFDVLICYLTLYELNKKLKYKGSLPFFACVCDALNCVRSKNDWDAL